MNPRSLRHRLEKAAKLLVIIQKHTPNAECILNEDKGDHGHIVIDFGSNGTSPAKMMSLGKDLESKGYKFTEKKSPWLGQITIAGRASDKPTIMFTIPIVKDRLAINDESPERPYSFTS